MKMNEYNITSIVVGEFAVTIKCTGNYMYIINNERASVLAKGTGAFNIKVLADIVKADMGYSTLRIEDNEMSVILTQSAQDRVADLQKLVALAILKHKT